MGGHVAIVKISKELFRNALGIADSFQITNVFESEEDRAADLFSIRIAGESLPLVPECGRLPYIDLCNIQKQQSIPSKPFPPGTVVNAGTEFEYTVGQ